MSITIEPVGGRHDLYCKYPMQQQQQSCYVELDPAARTLGASYNGEIGNAIPIAVYHGRAIRYRIPCLRAEAANQLMEEISSLAETVCDGYSKEWDGNNMVGRLTEAARDASSRIENAAEEFGDETDCVQRYEAGDWFGDLGPLDAQAEEFGINADTTDEELKKIVTKTEADANSDSILMEGTEEHLERIREHLREEA